jgi:hypothetical protein
LGGKVGSIASTLCLKIWVVCQGVKVSRAHGASCWRASTRLHP